MLQRLVEEKGWKSTWKKLEEDLSTEFGLQWFAKNRFLLRVFGLEELIGFDGRVSNLLDNIPDTTSFEVIQNSFTQEIIDCIRSQLENAGSTHFFDIEKMATSRIYDSHENECRQLL